MTSTQELTAKAYEEKINAELQQAKVQLAEFEARAKGKLGQVEINTINHLKTRQQELERKRQQLKMVSDEKGERLRADFDAEMAKLKTSLTELATKFRA